MRAASLKGGKRSGTRTARRWDSCCASLAIQKNGLASHEAGTGRVACAQPRRRQDVPARSAVGEGDAADADARARARRWTSATSAGVAETPPRVRSHTS